MQYALGSTVYTTFGTGQVFQYDEIDNIYGVSLQESIPATRSRADTFGTARSPTFTGSPVIASSPFFDVRLEIGTASVSVRSSHDDCILKLVLEPGS